MASKEAGKGDVVPQALQWAAEDLFDGCRVCDIVEYAFAFEDKTHVVVCASREIFTVRRPGEATYLLGVDFDSGEEFHVAVPTVYVD